MAHSQTGFQGRIDRRTFLLAGFAVATGAAAETPRLETFTQWLNASRKTRERALQPCVERIQAMNAPWTALGTPAITIPMPVGNGLPLGLQLTADHGQDARVIRTAVRLHQVLSDGPNVSVEGRSARSFREAAETI